MRGVCLCVDKQRGSICAQICTDSFLSVAGVGFEGAAGLRFWFYIVSGVFVNSSSQWKQVFLV